jgi:4-amino-4-deoxy-L-arabinose transferase-like glycosyltransferase
MTHRPLLALVGLWLAVCAAATAWITVDRRPPEWDHANHLERAMDCYRNLRIVTDSGAREILEASSFYPPLASCAAGALYLVFPITPLTAQVVMMGFLGLALACVYGLGRRLADVETGLWAAFLLGTAPFVVFSLTNFQLDLPLAAMVALTLYAILRAEDFGRRGWSLALGAALGLGMLTKPPFAAYVAPPLLWSLGRALASPARRRRLLWAAAALGIGAVLSLPWYGPRLFGLPAQMLNRSFKQAAEQQNPDPLTAAALSFYPRTLPTQLGLIAALLLLWGLWALGKEGRTTRAFLWLATLGPFVLFSLIQNKNLRYTLPILPAAVLVAAIGLRALPAAWRRAAGGCAVAAGILQVSMTLWALPPPPTLPGMLLPLAIGRPPSGADWQHDRILADLARASRGHAVTVAVVPNDNFFSVSNFRYEVVRRGLPYRMTRSWSEAPLGVDFIILKTGAQGPVYAAAKPERLSRAFAGGDPYWMSAFPVIAEYPLPDGSIGSLRARRIPPLVGVSPAAVAERLQRDPATLLADNVVDAQGLKVRLQYRSQGILRGEIDRAVLVADSAFVGEIGRRRRAPLRMRDIKLEAEGLLFNPQRLMREGRLEILDLKALAIRSLTVTEEDLSEFLADQPVGSGMSIALEDGMAKVRVTRFGPTLKARVRFGPGDGERPFTLSVSGVSLGGMTVPGPFVNWIVRHLDPTMALRRLPVPIVLEPPRIAPGRIAIGQN